MVGVVVVRHLPSSQEKSTTSEILGKYFLRTIVPRKYMRKISAVGLFCCDKFEETPRQKVIDLSKFKNFYFNGGGGENLAKIKNFLKCLVYCAPR